MTVDADCRTDTIPLFKSLKILTLTDRIEVQACKMIFRALHGEMPLYIQNVFRPLASISERVTR